MEFTGRITRVMPTRTGKSARTGNEWTSLPFVFEYFEKADDRWSDKVLLETMDESIIRQIGRYLAKGADGKAVMENGEFKVACELKVRCGFSHSVNSGTSKDGRPFTVNNVRLYKFEVIGGLEAPSSPGSRPATQPAKTEDSDGLPL